MRLSGILGALVSQKEFANKLGFSAAYINAIECGQREETATFIAHLVHGIDPAAFPPDVHSIIKAMDHHLSEVQRLGRLLRKKGARDE